MYDDVIWGFIAQINKLQDTMWNTEGATRWWKKRTFETIYTSASLPSLIMKAIMNYLSPLSPKSGQSNKQTWKISGWTFGNQLLPFWGCNEECSRIQVHSGYPPLYPWTIHPLLEKKQQLLNLSKLNENSLFKNVNINRYRTVDLREKTQEDSTCSDCLQH